MYWTVKPKDYVGSVLKSFLELLFVQLYYYGKNEEEECPPGMHALTSRKPSPIQTELKQSIFTLLENYVNPSKRFLLNALLKTTRKV